MRARWLPVLSVLVILMTAPLAHAAKRSVQVTVSGTALATFFASQGQEINVNADQLDLQTLSVTVGTVFEVRTFGPEASASSVGTYNANGNKKNAPARYTLSAAAMTPGWYVTGTYRSGPNRLVVNVFDATGAIQGTSTYNGANASNFALFSSGPNGTYYLEDDRNAGSAAKILAFAGTGARSGWTWFVSETSPGSGGDFADVVTLVNLSSGTTPTVHTAWGRLKEMYR